MQQDRLSRIARRLSVGATSTVLVLSAAGAASAHPLSVMQAGGADTEREALAALILRYEPFEDASGVDALVDQILVSWPGAGAFALGILESEDDEDASEVETPDADDDQGDDSDHDDGDVEDADEDADDGDADESDDDESDDADEDDSDDEESEDHDEADSDDSDDSESEDGDED